MARQGDQRRKAQYITKIENSKLRVKELAEKRKIRAKSLIAKKRAKALAERKEAKEKVAIAKQTELKKNELKHFKKNDPKLMYLK